MQKRFAEIGPPVPSIVTFIGLTNEYPLLDSGNSEMDCAATIYDLWLVITVDR